MGELVPCSDESLVGKRRRATQSTIEHQELSRSSGHGRQCSRGLTNAQQWNKIDATCTHRTRDWAFSFAFRILAEKNQCWVSTASFLQAGHSPGPVDSAAGMGIQRQNASLPECRYISVHGPSSQRCNPRVNEVLSKKGRAER
jgi:hypothetical protein